MKGLLIAGICLLVIGILVFVFGMCAVNWNIGALGTGTQTEVRTHAVTGDFRNVSIKSIAAEGVQVLPSTDGTAYVTVAESEKITYAVTVAEGTLTVERRDSRTWFERLFSFGSGDAVLVYLPVGEYGALSVDVITGDVRLERGLSFDAVTVDATTSDVGILASVTGDVRIDLTTGDVQVRSCRVGSLSVEVTTGDVSLTDVICTGNVLVKCGSGDLTAESVDCASFTAHATTGDALLRSVIATASLTVERTTGDVTLAGVDGGEILLHTTTGDVTGTILTEKRFDPHATTGDVRVPSDGEGGLCRVNTTTGDILLRIGGATEE
jgi:DUF4097 and DUF4098 domain-containing protein YvlB